MKSKTLILGMILSTTCAFGQHAQEGFIITNASDTLRGHFVEIGSYVQLENDETKYYPADIIAYGVKNETNGKEVWMEIHTIKSYYGKSFFLLEHAGKTVNLYSKMEQNLSVSLFNMATDSEIPSRAKKKYYYFKSDMERPQPLSKKHYDTSLKYLMKDCKQVADKIGSRRYKYKDIVQIFEAYGECQLSEKTDH